MNVRSLRLSTLGACLFAVAGVAMARPSALAPAPPNGNGGVIQSCGPDQYTYCYPNFWDSVITYQGTSTFPIAILFTAGTMEGCCDYINIYDGLDESAPPILLGVTENMSGVFAASTNPDHAIT